MIARYEGNFAVVRTLLRAYYGLFLLALILCVGWGVSLVEAQPPGKYVTVKSAAIRPDKVTVGGKATLEVTLSVADTYHINANQPGDEMMIPTVLTVDALKKGSGVSIGKPVYPAPATIEVGYSPKPIKGHEGLMTISVPVTVTKAKPGTVQLTGKVKAQGCNATSCFPPTTLTFAAPLTIIGGKK
jgi:DsbC/DsbD-like thiol-disulfide interchange protein